MSRRFSTLLYRIKSWGLKKILLIELVVIVGLSAFFVFHFSEVDVYFVAKFLAPILLVLPFSTIAYFNEYELVAVCFLVLGFILPLLLVFLALNAINFITAFFLIFSAVLLAFLILIGFVALLIYEILVNRI